MNAVSGLTGDISSFRNMSSKPRGTYLDPLKACALSGVSSMQIGKSESSTFTKYMSIVRQTRRTASRTSVLNDVERTRFTTVMKRIDSEHAYSTSVLDRQARMFRKSLGEIEKQKIALIKQRDGILNKNKKGVVMEQPNTITDLIKRHKKARKRGNEGGFAVSKKRVYKTRLPSITNESIQETDEEETLLNGNKESQNTAAPQKLSKRTSGRLTLPVFLKPSPEVSGDPKKSPSTRFYTGNDLIKSKNSSEVSCEAKPLKLPSINSKDAEWT